VSQLPTIAVIDDDAAIRDALQDLIGSLGYRSLLFASAEDYLHFVDRMAVACIIVDVKMPGLSGIELQNRLNQEGGKPPMIFMTSYFDKQTRMKAIAGGAHSFLGKPVDDEVLIGCLKSALMAARGEA
jgi:FixJ family two-component response regulator